MTKVELSRMERKKEQTKQNIVRIAMQLFNQQGFSSTTMEQISKETDIAKGTLYNYFSSKEAIVNEYVHTSVRAKLPKMMEQIQKLPNSHARIQKLLNKQVEYVHKNKEIMGIYMMYRMQQMAQIGNDNNLRSGTHYLLVKIIEMGQEQGEIRKDIPLSLLAAQLDYIRFVITMDVLKESAELSIEENITKSTDFFLNGASLR